MLTSSSKNHINVGPEIITIPTAITNMMENFGIAARVSFSFRLESKAERDGKRANAKKIIPPIHTAATKL